MRVYGILLEDVGVERTASVSCRSTSGLLNLSATENLWQAHMNVQCTAAL